jgi:TRAP-type C4-dicarboxylate transport system substrate-binding protein
MGNYKSVLKKIRLGQLQGGAVTGDSMLSVYPDMRTYSLPMMLRNYAEVDHLRPKIDPLLKKGMRKNGFELLGISEGGLVYLMSSDKILSTDDLKSHKVWIPEDDVLNESLFNKMGVSPISLPLADVYTGLQTGLIDTIGATPTGALAFQWHTRMQAVTDVPLLYIVGVLVISNKAFAKISDSDQAVVRKVMTDVFARMDSSSRKDNEKAREALKNNGIEFVKPEAAEIQYWKQLADEVINERSANVIESPLYQEITRLLNEYRKATR